MDAFQTVFEDGDVLLAAQVQRAGSDYVAALAALSVADGGAAADTNKDGTTDPIETTLEWGVRSLGKRVRVNAEGELEQVAAFVRDRALRHLERFVPRQHLGERALAAAITTHHGMDLTGADGEVHTLEDRLVLHPGMEIADLKQNGSVGADHGVGAVERGDWNKG